MARYGMVIDLKRCYGCYSCVMGCKQANCTPPGVFWSRVLRGEMGVYPNSVRQALPVLCNQCEEPDCMKVCPTGATYQTDDGIVRVDKDKCIGCKYCMMACPYGARYSVPEYKSYFPEGLPISDYEKHCMHSTGKACRTELGKAPISPRKTRLQNTPGGVRFACLHAITQE